MDKLSFEINEDPIKTASEQADEKIRGILGKLSRWRSVAVLGVMMLITMVLPLASFSLVNPWSVEFLINAVYSLIVATTCYYIFAPISARAERSESDTYREAHGAWLKLSQRVREGKLMRAFFDFCILRREEEREERKALFIEAAGIPREIYDERYANLNSKQLDKLKKNGELTKSQVKYLKSANGEIEVLPINASMILSGVKVDNINDVGREKRKRWLAAVRPITLVVTIVVRGIIHAAGNGDVGFMDYVTELMTTMSIILTWSFTGYRYGISLVREEEQLMQGRSEFILMFLERQPEPFDAKATTEAQMQKIPAREGGVMSQDVLNNVVQM